MRLIYAISGMLALGSALAAEYPIDIKTDLKGSKFFIVEKGGTASEPTLVVKRVGTGRTSYTKRQFDCQARRVRVLGRGETLEVMAKAEPEKDSVAIEPGSIPDQLVKHVCPK